MKDEVLETESSLDLGAIEEDDSVDDLFEPERPGDTKDEEEEEILDDEGNVIETDDLFESKEKDKVKDVDTDKEEVDDPSKPTEYKPGEYIAAMNEEYELGLHMENLPSDLTPQAEMDLAREIVDKRREANEAQVRALSSYDKLITADAETQQYLQDRAAGLTMKDMVAKYGSSANYTSEDAQMEEFLKEAYGFNDEQVAESIASMKEAGTYEARAKVVVERNIAKESEAIEAAEQKRIAEVTAQQEAWAAHTTEVGEQLKTTEGFGEFKFNDNIRKELLKDATNLDENGYTKLERDVQSTENSIKAAFALRYWDQFVQATAKGNFNTGKASVYDLLAADPEELQRSGGQSSRQESGISESLAGQF